MPQYLVFRKLSSDKTDTKWEQYPDIITANNPRDAVFEIANEEVPEDADSPIYQYAAILASCWAIEYLSYKLKPVLLDKPENADRVIIANDH